MAKKNNTSGLSRRDFLKTGATAGAAVGLQLPLLPRRQDRVRRYGPGKVPCELLINGQKQTVEIEPRVTLLRAIRDHLHLTGPKEVCDRGACGACTVLVDGAPIVACMTLALDVQGAAITTVEGLSKGGKLDPIQEAFVACDAYQCGFCTPGMVMACKALLEQCPDPTPEQIRRGFQGNICRCAAYNHIFEAARAAAKARKEGK
jgi:aerobic-type carbon monoxide dehydrogenase small subunit (CoxS/CutS family)